MMRETFTPGWGARILGAGVLVGAIAGAIGLALSGGAPAWTWILLALFGGAAAVASIANFGDRFHFDDDGITHENVLLRGVGRPPRRAGWDDVMSATEHDGRTLFLDVEGQGRWVLDQLDGHEHARALLEDRKITVTRVQRPRFWRRGATDGR